MGSESITKDVPPAAAVLEARKGHCKHRERISYVILEEHNGVLFSAERRL